MTSIEKLPSVQRIIDIALEEDIAHGDITSEATVPAARGAEAVMVAKSPGVIAGLSVAEEVFMRVDPSVLFRALVSDGDSVAPGTQVVEVAGPARSILAAERTALNFLQQLSGTATLTRRLVDLIAETSARLVDTRKTLPGLRALQKYAVRVGGGANHRFHLADAVLIKDNHIAAVGEVGAAVRAAKAAAPHTMKIECECTSLAAVEEALAAGADIVMLDNMSLDDIRAAVALVNGRALTEASGGVSEKTIVEIARTGVDLISCGALTHSAPALDIALDIVVG